MKLICDHSLVSQGFFYFSELQGWTGGGGVEEEDTQITQDNKTYDNETLKVESMSKNIMIPFEV